MKKDVENNYEPLVSVIIPVFNAENFLDETLRSIFSQNYRNIEIIVVDDGSTDNSKKIIQKYEKQILFFHQKNSGPSIARNKGLSKSSGDFLCFMDADDILMPHQIFQQVNFLKRYPDVGLVFTDYVNFNQNGVYNNSHFSTCPKLISLFKKNEEIIIENACRNLIEENFGISSSLMIRKEMTQIVSGFDPTLKASIDFHFYYRIARHTKTGIINKVGMRRRMHGNNISNNKSRVLTNAILSRTKLRDTEPDYVARSLFNKHIASCWSSLARYHANHRRFSAAMKSEFQAFSSDPSWERGMRSLYNILRTLAIAFRLHHSKEKYNETNWI